MDRLKNKVALMTEKAKSLQGKLFLAFSFLLKADR